MKKGLQLFFSLSLFLLLSGCGITQELEETDQALERITKNTQEQKETLQHYYQLIQDVWTSFEDDTATYGDAGGFINEEGKLYQNLSDRQSALKQLKKQNNEFKDIQKELSRIKKKDAVDVDNQQIELTINSLTIIEQNIESIVNYSNSTFELEEILYQSLPVKNLSAQQATIDRFFGSTQIALTETKANLDYTLSLVNSLRQDIDKQSEMNK